MSFPTNNTFFVFVAVWCLVSETLVIKTLKDQVLNSSNLKIMPVFWHTSPPEISVSASLGLSLFILMNGNSFPDFSDFIRSASAWVILLKSIS